MWESRNIGTETKPRIVQTMIVPPKHETPAQRKARRDAERSSYSAGYHGKSVRDKNRSDRRNARRELASF